MRSIRLSLLLYFLILVTTALGLASIVLYGTARATLQDKETVARKLIEAHYEERQREARERVDHRLLEQAKSLARRVQPQGRWDLIFAGYYHFNATSGLLGLGATPYGYLTAPSWILQGANWSGAHRPPPSVLTPSKTSGFKGGPRYRPVHLSRIQTFLWRHDAIHLHLPAIDAALPAEGDNKTIHRLQTNNWGPSLTGPQGMPEISLPDESGFAPEERLAWTFDTYQQQGRPDLRRVRLRAQLNQFVFFMDRAQSVDRAQAPALVVQCACDIRPLENALAELRTQRDEEFSNLATQTELALGRHRAGLVGILLVTFVATVLGCFCLVWLGLRPLGRLGEAVSQVSPRDFKLPIATEKLPLELRPIADRLSGTLDALKRAFAREKQATADISHELRTPLAALMTTLELALRKPRPAEQYREFLTDCFASTQQMHQTVERLLTLARLDAGVDRIRSQSVDLGKLTEQCAEVVRPLADARGLELAFSNVCNGLEDSQDIEDSAESLGILGLERTQGPQPSPAGPFLTTDPDKLREIVTNLLHNAIQYNRDAGSIELQLSRVNGHVEVAVRDTGIGIKPEALSHIFERFYRADPSRNSDGLHAGLGLSIVKEYVELLGGQIEVESEPDQGSTFRVLLPAGVGSKPSMNA